VTTVADGVPAFYKKYFRCVDITMDGTDVLITTKDLPPHASPYYPANDPGWTAFDTMGGDRVQNPNRLSEQSLAVRVPAAPKSRGLTIDSSLVDHQAGNPFEYHFGQMSAAGICLDGVAMFHGVAAPGDDIAQEEHTFDTHEGHPQNTGVYHYHSASPGPLEVLQSMGLVTSTVPGSAELEVYAIMCDGTLVLGCKELDGSTPDGGDLDAQNGHVHDIKDSEAVHFTQRYHTHLCRGQFPDGYAPEIQYYDTCGAATGSGGSGGAGGMQGPKSCTTSAECAGACPPGSQGCTCHQGMTGLLCLPSCQADADCPTGTQMALACDTQQGICVPKN
jgi:hypothetical protein